MTESTDPAPTGPDVVDHHPETDEVRDEILAGLTGPGQKTTPAKYLYDTEGSVLFDAITETEEYYPTRTEMGIVEASAGEIAEAVGPEAVVIEPGAGSKLKIEQLLGILDRPRAYVPLEISLSHLEAMSEEIHADFPDIEVAPINGDFTRPMDIDPFTPEGRRLVYFPGSTIGNLFRETRATLLERFADMMGEDGLLLIGTDLQKPLDVLLPAYDDAAGVTAAFNKNLLVRLNRELDGNFDVGAFRHEARYNTEHDRVEMHLVSERDTNITLAGQQIELRAGESIHTENSHKFTIGGFDEEAAAAGLKPERIWTDSEQYYALRLYSLA